MWNINKANDIKGGTRIRKGRDNYFKDEFSLK